MAHLVRFPVAVHAASNDRPAAVGQQGVPSDRRSRAARPRLAPTPTAAAVAVRRRAAPSAAGRRSAPTLSDALGPSLAAQTRWQARSSRQDVALCHDDYDCGAALTTGVSSLTVGSGTW